MNDPGLDQPAQEAAQDVETKAFKEENPAEQEEQEFLDPSRWWFASTACPLVAGTFGPMANAFSICALVESWRVHIPPGKDEGHGIKIEDPKWLLAVNSISLVLALTANMALLLNMARRVSFAIAQPITIVGWYLASILLIALVAVASSSVFRLQPMQEHALSQAYYYGIIAAVLYFIIATLMVFTVLGAYRGHYDKDFQLTPSQRTLMLQTIGFMVYLLLGALIFSKIEGWNFLDAVYWADFTLLTVGIGGEYVPATHAGRSLLFPYAIGGLIMVGLVIGSVRSLILEHGKQKIAARFVEKKRQRVVSTIDDETRTITLGFFEKIRFSEKGLSETQRREQEFKIMRRIHSLSERKRRYTALAFSGAAALLLWLLGALVFKYAEKLQGMSYFAWLYFSYTSLLTIGYGDLTLSSNSGKAFFVFWSLLAVPTLTVLISNMGDTIIKTFKDFTIWLGSITVLPGEERAGAVLKVGVKKLGTGNMYRAEEKDCKETLGMSEQRAMDRLAQYAEEDELEEAKKASEHGDYLLRDIHFYHFVLTKEIRQLMKDAESSSSKKYSYQEWCYFLRLIRQDETDASAHRKPSARPDQDDEDAPDIGTADDSNSVAWSWLGIRSPLMGNKSEPQWLLQRLLATLETEIRRMRSTDEKERNKAPPISMADLRKKNKSQDTDEIANLKNDIEASDARRRGHEVV